MPFTLSNVITSTYQLIIIFIMICNSSLDHTEVSTTGIESGNDAATNVSREGFAQRKGGYVNDVDCMFKFRHVGELSPV